MRRIRQLGAITFALFLFFLLVGCINEEIDIIGIEIDPISMSESVDISEFDLTDLKLLVTYSDESVKSITVKDNMISSTDLAKLSFRGTHEITISYEGFDLIINIVLEDQETLDLILDYYEFITSAELFSGTYQEWLQMITEEGTLFIRKATLNNQNQVVITFSNLEEHILGVMGKLTFEVNFFDKDGILLTSIVVEQGSSVVPPSPPNIKDYQFTGWDQQTNNIQSDLNVYANYDFVGPNPLVDNPLDELIFSLDRLRNAQFDVDIESIFKLEQKTNRVSLSKSLISILSEATSASMDDPFNQDDFIQHPLYTGMYYHQGMYTMAEIIDGYHIVTTSLSTYANNAINNMTLGVKNITARAKESAYWAVDNITIANAWIVSGNIEYLLHYNEILDRVEYYQYQYIADQKTHYYEKIFIFYNAKGEEVIERYFEYRYEEVYSDGYFGSISYYNSVAGRDFNYLQIWLDEDYKSSDNMICRGVNLNDEGVYEYYENDILMISGGKAWYEVMPMINHTKQNIEYQDYRPFTVYSPDGTSNVMTFSKNISHYSVELYIPAFDGIDAVLVEEEGMYEIQQDPESVIQEIINRDLELMPMRWEMDVHNNDIMTGFKTAKGTFIADSEYNQNGVSIDKVNLYITREGMYDYQLYYNYLGVIQLSIEADAVDLMFDKLILFMNQTGITYEYGNIFELLDEVQDQYEMRHDTISTFNYLNPVMGGPKHSFKDYSTYIETYQFIENYLDQYQLFEEMKELYPTIDFTDMPSWDQIGVSTFINLEGNLTGTALINELIIDTNPIQASLEPSLLLKENDQYALFYSLLTEGRLIPIGYEDPQTYQKATLTFEGDQEILIPIDLAIGQYQLVLFFGKVIEDRFIRVSNVIPMSIEAFEMIEIIETDAEAEYSLLTEVFNEDGSLYINIQSIDLFAPKVMIDENPTIYQSDTYFIELSIESGKTVLDLLSRIQINDTYEPSLYPVSDFVFKDDLSVLLTDEITGDGWKLIISDSSGNSTTIVIDFKYIYDVIFMVGDEIYQQLLVEEETLVDLPIEPNQEGLTFIGWNLEDLLITTDTIYHAIFERNTYTISYYIDLGLYDEQEIFYGDEIVFLVPTILEGYTFSKWDTTLEFMPAIDLTLHAIYLINQYSISFETNGGSTIESITTDYGSDVIAPADPFKEGYTFEGWYIDEELLTAYTFAKMTAEDITIYAKWQINS